MVDDGALREEIRLACVFNGGVSLAVWMGGVAHELNELTGDGRTYGPLLRLLGVRARADVISGTSAGGINGAALALAQVNRHTRLTDLRRVWADQGRLETLLNAPFRGHPSSLLRGEEVFLPELTRALQRLATPWEPRPVAERPIDLTVTTTLLEGVTLQETDSFGQLLSQHRHDAHFRFVRGADGAGRVRDDFALPEPGPGGDPAAPAPREDIIAALGLAARASAGFPVAFEPTLIPVDPAAPVPGRPDMAPYASWRGRRLPGAAGRPDRSRYATDGGLLNNTPTQHSLAAIEHMRADLAVDRVMLLVVPLAAAEVIERGARDDEAPLLTGVARGLAASVTSTGSRTFVDDVARHNRMATSLRGTRHDVLSAAESAADLRATAERVYPHYRRLRLRRDARDLAVQPTPPAGMADAQVRLALETAQGRLHPSAALPPGFTEFAAGGRPPEAGDHFWGWGSKTLLDVGAAALEYFARLLEAWPARDHGPVLEARGQVHEALAQVRWVRQVLDDAWTAAPTLVMLRPEQRYWLLRLAVDSWLLGGAPAALEQLVGVAAALDLDADELFAPTARALATAAGGAVDVHTLAGAGGVAGILLGAARAQLVDAVVTLGRPEDQRRLGAALPAVLDPAWHPLLDAAGRPDPRDARAAVWELLIALHVVSWTIGDELPTENTNPLRLTQVSAATHNDFAEFSRTVDEKLGGASLARFSGFLKRSWRMNDWAWGRFDGASAALRVVLTPRRVRALALSRGLVRPEDVVDLLLTTAWGPGAAAALDGGAVPAAWQTRLGALRTGAAREVAAALRATLPPEMREEGQVPDAPAMPDLAALLTYGRHLAVVHEELPEVAAAVREDAADGANPRSRGELFLTQHAALLERLHTTKDEHGTAAWLAHGLEALSAFDRAGIGREPLEEEGASDQLIRTAVTAAAVSATVVAGQHSGLGVLAPVTRAVKGVTLIPYWVTQGLTSAGLVARTLGVLGLAAGGVLLVLALLGVLDGALAGIAATLGAGAFLTALTYGALRTGSQLHGVVLALAATALLGAGISAARGGWELSLGMGAVLGATILIGGLTLLGSLRQPMRSPKALVEDAGVAIARRTLGRTWTERNLRLTRAAGLVVVTAAAAAGVVLLVADGAGHLDRLHLFTGPSGATRWWLGGAVALAGVLATVAVLLASRGLRRWLLVEGRWQRERSSGPAGVSAGWSVVYGVVSLVGCALALRWWPEGQEVVWSVAWVVAVLGVFAVALMVPAPLLTLWRARRTVRRRAAAALDRVPDLPGAGDLASRRAAWLEANGWAYSALVRAVPDDDGGHLELRPRTARRLARVTG